MKKAFQLYKCSALKGNTSAIYNIGDCYKLGMGTEINIKEAFYWYKMGS